VGREAKGRLTVLAQHLGNTSAKPGCGDEAQGYFGGSACYRARFRLGKVTP
jgi:hypothetical protein